MGGDGGLMRRFVYSLFSGAALSFIAWHWGYAAMPPGLAEAYAAAAGLRPPESPTGLLWQALASPLFGRYGVETADLALRAAGCAALGLLAALSYTIFEMMLPVALRRGEHIALWWRVSVRAVLFQGVVFFCCSDSVWSAFRRFSPVSLQILLAAFATLCIVSHFRTGRHASLFAAYFLLGLLAADAPAGMIGAAVLAAAMFFRGMAAPRAAVPACAEAGQTVRGNPVAEYFMSWRSTLSFCAGFAAGWAVEYAVFAGADGFAAHGWKTWGDYALQVPAEYIKTALAIFTPLGALLFAAFAVAPVVIQAGLLGSTTDNERHLRYFHGVVFATLGLFALTQVAGSGETWYWTWGGINVRDDAVRGASAFLTALAAVWSAAVFMEEMFFRNFKRIATLRFPDAVEETDAAKAFASARRMQHSVRMVFVAEPFLAIACVVPFRAATPEREMAQIVADAAKETARECRGAGMLFTDGGLDAQVELAAAAEGRILRTLSFMSGAVHERDIYLRTRGATNAADRAVLELGAADALRKWTRFNPEKGKSYATQIGFELWQRDGREMPDFSGIVARPEGLDPEEASRGAAAARGLMRRILSLCEEHPDLCDTTDRPLRNAFAFVQWRLSIIARHRANSLDAKGEKEAAVEDTELANALDAKNSVLARIRTDLAWAGRRKLERMTAQEGLRAGLAKANFQLARQFALAVLRTSPEDPQANFAIGMDFFVQKQYSRAEAYLSKCLAARPNDPAVLNNLAQCRLRQGDPAKALEYARRALEFLPDSPEIKRTIERAEAAAAAPAGRQ